MDLHGSVALVTGGASGLGRATVEALAARGANVAIVDRDADRAKALAAAIGGDRAFAAPADVADGAAMSAVIDDAASRGPLRVAVACAGVGWAARTVDKDGKPHDLELFRKVIDVNLVGTFNVLRLAAAAMAKAPPLADGQRGVIIGTASVAAFEGQIGQVAYSASKGAVVAMTLPAARDLAKVGVRVMTIAPGTFDTPMLAALPEEARKSLAAAIPNPSRLGDPTEYARLALSIVDNAYLNGTVIRIDGALRMAPK
ncbi:SDR family NAD(P)-dependent oxidoreductase [Sandaracinus amylolyticus]|uniref:SDR family NAD(P)-dependent oxidoreductase n=1 Tax=Sandaracinus amylolyticus TaxID=927083 RepID=UPI001F396FEA|nr:SDR family NAD(P)-dependent oxidoreductase [Sandaracinus amylolyticus]UJR79645.1 NADP-dependent 3-hydroxy acid dehydrogenase YdfG [Sandaracinus amylolyticus]